MNNLFGQPTERGLVLGCDQCPSNRVPGIVKILGLNRVTGKRGMIWAMCPGKNENIAKQELVGSSGQLLWRTLAKHQLPRTAFDVQNVVRCWNVNSKREEWAPNSPEFKRALKCCSPFNAEALQRNAGRAAVHMILGDVAGQQLLGTAFRKDRPIFWYKPWNAYVVLNWHPSFIVRQGGEQAGWNYYEWRDRMRAVKVVLDNPGRHGYIRAQDYAAVHTLREFDDLERKVRAEAAAGRRVSVDIEDGIVEGKRVVLMVGFGWGRYTSTREKDRSYEDWNSWRGGARSVIVDHPDSQASPTLRNALVTRLKQMLEDPKIIKCLQHGSYDGKQLLKLLGIRLAGYNYDTQYGTYLRYSFMRKFGLEEQVLRFLPEFCDYKYMMEPYHPNLANAPLGELVLYNCADCDVTKRLESRFSPQVNQALVKVYCDCAFTLDAMEKRGPWLDWQSHKELSAELPPVIKRLDRELAHLSGDPNFNAKSSDQVKTLLYDTLGLEDITGERDTEKETLELLAAKTGSPVPEKIKQRRALGVVGSTFLKGYAVSAKKHGGQVRTIWWLTGAITGRLRSGRGDRAEAEGVINMQNLHGNPILQNLLVSDPNWRKAL